jgi:hypothetical protein
MKSEEFSVHTGAVATPPSVDPALLRFTEALTETKDAVKG